MVQLRTNGCRQQISASFWCSIGQSFLGCKLPSMVTGNMHICFELNRKHRLDAIVFTHIRTHTNTHIHHRKNNTDEFSLELYRYIKNSISNSSMITLLSLHCLCSERKNHGKYSSSSHMVNK